MTVMNKNTKKHQKSFHVFVLGLALVCASLVSILNTRPILANAVETVCKETGSKAAVCNDKTDVMKTASKIINYIAVVTGMVSVAFIVYAGAIMVFSVGSPDKFRQAKNIIIYAVVGLILAILAGTIVNFVLNKL